MPQRILITGSSGLVGISLTSRLLDEGSEVVRFDLDARGDSQGDVRDPTRVNDAVVDVDGIVHLAAVSRVIWGERNPPLCWETNVGGLRNVIAAAAQSRRAPWLIFASSREVYGQPESLPATEDAPLLPMNVYGRSKAAGERLVKEAQDTGLRACTVRLSNVFGATSDHADRVVPAFARAAATGAELRVDGLGHTFDFTHIDDVTRGMAALINLLEAREAPPPPIHLVSGRPTTLEQLATLAASIGETGSPIRASAPREFDVARFIGDPSRAKALLGWRPMVGLEEGLARLVHAFREEHNSAHPQEVAR